MDVPSAQHDSAAEIFGAIKIGRVDDPERTTDSVLRATSLLDALEDALDQSDPRRPYVELRGQAKPRRKR